MHIGWPLPITFRQLQRSSVHCALTRSIASDPLSLLTRQPVRKINHLPYRGLQRFPLILIRKNRKLPYQWAKYHASLHIRHLSQSIADFPKRSQKLPPYLTPVMPEIPLWVFPFIEFDFKFFL